ncbi:MAG TPA: cupin domain-containing protein [Candidatus Limnocylindria bacterium]|nr:cupin domain-containing protein [Candidatus Limnocylindria bacterium]
MTDFYDDWLRRSAALDEAMRRTPVVARADALRWVTTVQDARTAMIIGEAAGFQTSGTTLLIAEIPAGERSGRHAHGEEAIHILAGTGFSVIDGARYDWKPGTTLHIPYRAEHQHVNMGTTTAVYLSAHTQDLDFAVKLGRLIQLEEKGAGDGGLAARYPAQTSQFAADGRRIALHLEDAMDENARRLAGHAHPNAKADKHAGRHAGIWILMGGSESPTDETNGFRASAVAMSTIFEEAPHSASHSHTHTEAMLYVLEGRGYSLIDGERHEWKAGDAVHVPPRMTLHGHFNDSDERTRTLRIEFGIRYFYESLWSGYEKVKDKPSGHHGDEARQEHHGH